MYALPRVKVPFNMWQYNGWREITLHLAFGILFGIRYRYFNENGYLFKTYIIV